VPHSKFAVKQRGFSWVNVQKRAFRAMMRIKNDANVKNVKPLGDGRFLVEPHSGPPFFVTVVTADTGNGNPAEIEVNGDQVELRISRRAKAGIIERAVANAVAQADAVISGAQTNVNLLDGDRHPGSNTKLSAEDQGRQAEVRNLDRTSQKRLRRRRRVGNEMKALVEHLGLHPDDEVSPQRRAVSDVGNTVDTHIKKGDKRPSWALPPDGYPKWKAFLLYHLPAEVLPGSSAALAIYLVGAPGAIAGGVLTFAVVSGVSGTLIKRWYGRRDKTNVDTGHGVSNEIRTHEAFQRRKKLLDPLFARHGGLPRQGPAEPAPDGTYPAKYQNVPARLLMRGGPAVLGALAATGLMAAGLPVWNALQHWAVAAVASVGGTIVEKYFRNSLIEREWRLLANAGREADRQAFEFDKRFVKQLAALLERIEHLSGNTSGKSRVHGKPGKDLEIDETGRRHYGAAAVPGALGPTAQAGPDALGKHLANDPGVADVLTAGGVRSLVGALVNTFLDRNFITNEYGEIVTQVKFDYGNKMAQQVQLEHDILNAMLADLTARVDAAEQVVNRVNATLASRAAHMRATAPSPQTLVDPGARPAGHQKFKAFITLHTTQGVVTAGTAAIMAATLGMGTAPMVILGAVGAAIVASAPLRYLWRRSEQIAVDETIFADRAREIPVEKAEAQARQQFMTEYWVRVIEEATGQRTPSGPPAEPQVPRSPSLVNTDFVSQVAERVAYERERLFHEPRPWTLLGQKLAALQRLELQIQRVHDFTTQANGRPLTQARRDLHTLWQAYQELRDKGTPMPVDYELLSNEKPAGVRGGRPSTGRARQLRSYLDTSVVTPAGRAFYAAGQMPANAHKVPAEPGQYTIDIHGGPDFVRIGTDRLTADDLAALIEADPNWNGEPIRLLACETGLLPNGFAQQLADRLGVWVYAPSEMVGIGSDGKPYVPRTGVNKAGLAVPGRPPTMNAFRPAVPRGEMGGTAPLPVLPHRSATQVGMWWPHDGEVEFAEQREVVPVKELGELTLFQEGPTVYTGSERLWPDELAEVIAERGDWAGGPTRLQVDGGHVDPEFVQRLADLLGAPVVIPNKSVAGEFPTLSSGTLEVYNEPAFTTVPPGCRVYEPRSVTAGKGTP
jgi:hypothetical protein